MQSDEFESLKQRRKANLKDFYAEITGYTNDLIRLAHLKELSKPELRAMLANIAAIEEMKKVFQAQIVIKKSRKHAAIRLKAGHHST